ncbi:MAG: dihydropteroate synthase [Methanomicrobiales archaeon]|nr:dihydropteroate synthase [Methanomicrobiales archaeon]
MPACLIGKLKVGDGAPVRLMGVINCSPESFYAGSYVPPGHVREQALAMIRDGADMIDIGARATGPGTPSLPPSAERARMEEALSALDGSGIPVSVDTTVPEVLEACLRHDVAAVNDIRGLADPLFGQLVSGSGLPLIAMASRVRPGDARTLEETVENLKGVMARCARHEIDQYILDPAIGLWVQGRTPALDWLLCRNFRRFMEFDRPVLAAVSRKSFLGDLLGRDPKGRLAGSLAVTVLLVRQGAAMVRTHDVKETRDALAVLQRMG